MKVLGIIPARYGSTRLEGKPLLDIGGKSMIRRVYERASLSKSLSRVIVATDSNRIVDECRRFSMDYMLTSGAHRNGTERCGEVIDNLQENFDVVINIQGDEPFIHPSSIDALVNLFMEKPFAVIGTLIKPIYGEFGDIVSFLDSSSIIKVTKSNQDKALYFSRNMIPSVRDIDELANQKLTFYKHLGIYGFKVDTLQKILTLEESCLEKLEKLEQLRWLENGYDIYVAETNYESKSVDTIEDYNYIIEHISEYNHE